jgi:hypothetical protein
LPGRIFLWCFVILSVFRYFLENFKFRGVAGCVDKMAARGAVQLLVPGAGQGPPDGEQELHGLALPRHTDHHQVTTSSAITHLHQFTSGNTRKENVKEKG